MAAPSILPINFGDLSMYVAGGGFPEGNYALEFEVMNYQAKKKDGSIAGPPRLGVMVKAHSLDDTNKTGDNAYTQFYSLGSNADKSFAPNPETGKGLVAIPGAAGVTLNDQSNWAYFLKSLYDCGLPNGVFVNDLTTIDGVHVHVIHMPEPEGRKQMSVATGEAANEPKRPGTIAVVSEIKEDGKPWEGTGGFDFLTAKPAAKAGPKAAAKPAAAPKAAPKAAAPAPAASAGDEDVANVATDEILALISDKPEGMKKTVMKVEIFKRIKDDSAKGGIKVASAVQKFINVDANLNQLLETAGYTINGNDIVPVG